MLLCIFLDLIIYLNVLAYKLLKEIGELYYETFCEYSFIISNLMCMKALIIFYSHSGN